MHRICSLCEYNKPITQYHADSKGRGGYAARCKDCRNAKRRKRMYPGSSGHVLNKTFIYESGATKDLVPTSVDLNPFNKKLTKSEARRLEIQKQKPTNQVINDGLDNLYGKPFKVKINAGEYDLDEVFASLIVKFNSHFVLSVSKNGKTVMNVHCKPERTFKGLNVRECVEKALS